MDGNCKKKCEPFRFVWAQELKRVWMKASNAPFKFSETLIKLRLREDVHQRLKSSLLWWRFLLTRFIRSYYPTERLPALTKPWTMIFLRPEPPFEFELPLTLLQDARLKQKQWLTQCIKHSAQPISLLWWFKALFIWGKLTKRWGSLFSKSVHYIHTFPATQSFTI